MKRMYSFIISIFGLVCFATPLYPQANPSGQNVAPLATVSVSATGDCYLGVCPTASGINDGNAYPPGAFWSGASGSSTGWVLLTLDQTYTLSKIRVFSQYWDVSVYGVEGGLEYSVSVSTDNSNWTVVHPASFALKKTVNVAWAREDINFAPQSVRYIKVDIVNSTGVSGHIWRTGIEEIEAGDANLPLHSWGEYFNSLVAYYPFNSNANDESGNGNNGVVDGATLTSDRFGDANSAYSFDGISNIISVNDDILLRPTTYTICVWVKHDSTPNSYFLFKGRAGVDIPGENYTYGFAMSTDSIFFGFEDNNGTDYSVTSTQVDTLWHFLVGSYDGAELKLYVDGSLVASLATSAIPETNSYPLNIGKNEYWPGDIYKGVLDDIRIYNAALSIKEIDSLYHEGGWDVSSTVLIVDSLNAVIMDTVIVPIRVQIQSGKSYSSAEVHFNGFQGSLHFLGIDTTGTMLGAHHWMYSVNGSDSTIVIASAGSSDISGDGVLFKLEFVATGSPCFFAPVNIDFAVFNTGAYPVAILNGGVHIKAIPVYGDVDENGRVQAYDASLILKYLAGADTLLTCQTLANADVTNNNAVTAFDASVILQYVTELITGLPYDSTTMGPTRASATFALQDKQAQATGDVVEIPVQFTDAQNVKSLAATLTYNSSELEYQDIRWQDTAGFVTATSTDVNKGIIKLFGASAASSSENGVVANLRFKVKKQSKVLLKELQLNESAQQQDVSVANITIVTGVKRLESAIPEFYSLSQNYPNPFNPTTTISYQIKNAGHTRLAIYDVLGREVAVLVNEYKQAGYYSVQWDAHNVSSGIYFYRLTATGNAGALFTETKRMAVMK